jgi:hypothetical protein
MRDQAGFALAARIPRILAEAENLQGTMMQYGLTLTPLLERAGKLFPFVVLLIPICTVGPALWRQVCSMPDSDKATVSRP